MSYKLTVSALLVGAAFFALPGCTANAESDEGPTASQDELTSTALVGAFHLTDRGARPAAFEGIVFQQNGDFFADVDTGIRCVQAPCPSHVRIQGRYAVTRDLVNLTAPTGEQPSGFHGQYRFAIAGGKLTLTRDSFAGWTNTLSKELSYCAAASECAGQDLIHPMCVGAWSCSEQRSCSWTCGVLLPEASTIWPADKTKLVAETKGGGFSPPPAPGSTCTLGAQKYELDLTTRKLVWEQCSFTDWNTPMHPIGDTRTLSVQEVATISAAMDDVKLTSQQICGADKPLLSIEVTSASQGTKSYADSFYSCMGGERQYVDNIYGVFSAFDSVISH